MKLNKVETTYHAQLKASEYDFLEVVRNEHGQMTVKFLDTRWRSKEETIALFKEIIAELETITP